MHPYTLDATLHEDQESGSTWVHAFVTGQVEVKLAPVGMDIEGSIEVVTKKGEKLVSVHAAVSYTSEEGALKISANLKVRGGDLQA